MTITSETAAAPGFSLDRKARLFLWAALLGLIVIRLVAVVWLPFVDSTEARYAEIARKMLETGDWITPQFDYGVPFWGKPPLHTWLSALGMKAFGVGAFGARIFIMVTGLATLGLVYAWVRRHKVRDQALLASVVLMSSVLFFGSTAFVMTDMAMVLGTTLSMIAFFNCATDPRARRVWGHLFFVGVAIGLLAKGPVALVLTLIPIGGWVLLGRRWYSLSALPWRSGLVLAAVLTLPWYIVAEIKTPGFLRYFIIGEHFERFVVPGWEGDLYGGGHERAKGMIWAYILGTFLPWTPFAALLLLRPRALRATVSADGSGWHSYLALWVLSALILFTMAANILPAYTLPSMPAAAVLLVSLWAGVLGAPGPWARGLGAGAVGLVMVLMLAIPLLSVAAPQVLRLKTERELVVAAQARVPGISLSYLGERSYSAEFYTAGQVTFLADGDAILALGDNDRPDAVAVPEGALDRFDPVMAADFKRIGLFGRRYLFIERAALDPLE